MIENPERTVSQVGILLQYLRVLEMVYKEGMGELLDKDVVLDVQVVTVTAGILP